MDTFRAFARGMANRGQEMKVFDWELAARTIKKHGAQFARAGLAGDWEWTVGDILRDGKPVLVDSGCYLASTWATPELEINDWRMSCYRTESETPGWDADTLWPPEALAILEEA